MVVSETSRRQPDGQISKWIAQQPDGEIAISVLTIGEIRKGIITARDPAHRRRLVEWFMREFEPGFSRVALPVTDRIAYEWGHLAAEAASRRRVLPAVDGLIAATAYVHGLTVVTRNVRHFVDMDVPVLNPWEPTPD
jgi:predicted nucleic acid-binding protein